MKCPKCASTDLKVNEKRDLEAEKAIRRRRECNVCGHRFTTYERIEVATPVVIKRNGEKELYNRLKLSSGVKKAFEKRPITEEQIEELLDEIESRIHLMGDKEISSKIIGNFVLEAIKPVDDVAYLRFASVYKSFADAESFQKELNKVIKH